MARNKHPEETERRILEAARSLFAEKGYEHTTIADIVTALGMSKGAVYHHFKSKEAIYDRITDAYYNKQLWYRDPSRLPGRSGLEKLRGLFVFLLSDPEKLEVDRLSASLVLNSRFLALVLESSLRDAAPLVEQLIAEANADGSAHVERPRELAEALMLLVNLWVGACTGGRADFLEKLIFLRDFTDRMGLPFLDGQTLDAALRYYDAVMSPPAP